MSSWATLRALVRQAFAVSTDSGLFDPRAHQRWLVVSAGGEGRWTAPFAREGKGAYLDGPEPAGYWAVTATIGARRPNQSADVGPASGIGMPPDVW